jgi:hypothetical protein
MCDACAIPCNESRQQLWFIMGILRALRKARKQKEIFPSLFCAI